MQNKFSKMPLFLSILFLGISLFFFLYLFRKTNENNQKLQIAENEWQREILRRDEIKMLDRSVKIIEGERAQLETHFAQSSDVVPFLDSIERLAVSAGTKAEVVSVNILGDHTGLLVGMKASGNFESLYKFLTLLENSSYELDFVSMDMSKEVGVDVTDKNVKISKWDVVFKMKLLSFIQ